MEKSTEDQIHEIMASISKSLGVDVALTPDKSQKEKLVPCYDVNAITSKFFALWIYMGLNVPSNPAPPYNRVHADIEYWKKRFEQQDKKP